VNGLLVNTVNSASFSTGYYNIYGIGTGGTNDYFYGYIDELRIYTRKLLQNEIIALYTFSNIITNNNNNYRLYNNLTTANIFRKPLTAIYFGIDKVYNAITLCSISYTLSGIIVGDFVDISNFMMANFIDINVGVNKSVLVSQVNLYGSSYFNYVISVSGVTYATITQAPLTSNFYSLGKVYDRLQYAPVWFNLSGVFDIDNNFVDISRTVWYATYRDYNVGSYYIDISNILIFGPASANYNLLSSTSTISGPISKRYLYMTGVDKIYDRKTVATLTISNIVGDDTISYTAQFADINYGISKSVYISLSSYCQFYPINVINSEVLNTNVDINYNYQIYNSIATASILQKPLTAIYFGIDKVYNGITLCSISYTLSGIIAGDFVDISNFMMANFIDIYVGNNKPVLVSQVTLYGSSFFNYAISISGVTYANITIAPIFVSFLISKYYDKQQTAIFTYNLSGIFNNDLTFVDLSSGVYGLYRDRNAGYNIAVDISNIVLTGPYTNIQNYSILNYITVSGDIFKRYLYSTGNDRIYDQTRYAQVTISNILNNDYIMYNASFDTRYFGYNKLITINLDISGGYKRLYVSTFPIIDYVLTSNTFVLINDNYILNGYYAISSSSNNSDSTAPFNVFNNSFTTFWSCDSQSYSASTGIYLGNNSTNINNIGVVNGEWIQIQYPFNLILTDYDLLGIYIVGYNYELTRIPSTFYVVGSNDGNSWNSIDYRYNLSLANEDGGLVNKFNCINNNASYSYYRLIVVVNGDPSFNYNRNIINLNMWRLRGFYNSYIVNRNYNYQLYNYTTTANVFTKLLNLVIRGGTKIYDGLTTVNNLIISLSGIIYGDYVSISSYISKYKSPNVDQQVIDISNMVVIGIDYVNYTIQSWFYIGTIYQKYLVISYIPSNKIYDGLTYTDYQVTANGFVNGETLLNLSGKLSYAISTNDNLVNPNSANYIIVGNGTTSTIIWSSDGINWNNASNNPFGTYCMNLATNNNIWVAVGSGNNSLAYSYDGMYWMGISGVFSVYGLGITWRNNIFYAVGQGTNTIAWSNNGINWNGLGVNIFSDFARYINSTKYIIVAIGSGTNTIAYSYDGIIWTGLGNILFDSYGVSVVNNDVFWLAFGKGSQNTIAYSYDGVSWFGLGTKIFTNYGSYAAWNGYMWVAVGAGTNTIAYSYDGILWTGIGNSIFDVVGNSIRWSGSLWYAVGTNVNLFATSPDGINWTPFTTGTNLLLGYDIEIKNTITFYHPNEVINVDNYLIKPVGYYSHNYLINYIYGYTIINKAKLYIRPNDYHKIYDNIIFSSYGITYTGFILQDSSFNLQGNLTYVINDTPLNVGKYYITTSGLIAQNYEIVNTVGTLTITKAPLVIRANNITKIYDTIPIIPSYTIYGLKVNDSLMNLSGSIIYSGSYYNQINVGTYTISLTGLYSNNYDIRYISSTLVIQPAPLLIIAKDDSRIYTKDISSMNIIYNPYYFTLF